MRRVRLSPIVVVALAALLPVAVHAKDCGRLPTGKNPSVDEIARAMGELAGKAGVPTEIVKCVAYQESGVQQWRADGSFVHNVTDCGLGMMQLTGSTADQFDVEKLKDDWKYNLECGIKVLNQKWAKAQGEGKVSADPADKRVLENWYYPVAYYYGARNESYLTKIFAHMSKRPGPLAKLLSRAVEVTLPSAAIPGFTFGKKFRALPGDRFEDETGKTSKGATHLGTVGDEATVAQLEVWLAKAKKARKANQTAEAVKLLAKACEVEYELEPRIQARKLLDELEREGEQRLADAEAKAQAGEREAAVALAKKVAADFAPVPLGARAKARAAELAKPGALAPPADKPAAGPAPSTGGPPLADPPPPPSTDEPQAPAEPPAPSEPTNNSGD